MPQTAGAAEQTASSGVVVADGQILRAAARQQMYLKLHKGYYALDKGFFIVAVRCRGISAGIKSTKHWRADLSDPVQGWIKTTAETLEAVIISQKEQYDLRIREKQLVPALISSQCSPMASGQTMRFVPVTDAS